MARSTAIPSFAQMGAILSQYNSKPAAQTVFSVTNTTAATRYSAPMQIVAVHYNQETQEMRVVGEDTNVRVCKVARMDINMARELWKKVVEAKNSTREVQFMAAGGFDPNRWFFDIKG